MSAHRRSISLGGCQPGSDVTVDGAWALQGVVQGQREPRMDGRTERQTVRVQVVLGSVCSWKQQVCGLTTRESEAEPVQQPAS